jgi:glycine dehydrogenase
VVGDLTGLPTANASLLDEATAVVEAVMVMRRASRSRSARVLVDADTLPQTLAVLAARAEAVGIEVQMVDLDEPLPDGDFFGLLASYPGCSGEVAVRDGLERHLPGRLVGVSIDAAGGPAYR